MRGKMKNWLNIFQKFEYLASLGFYYKTLKQTAHLAYVMQDNTALITDIQDKMQDCLEKLKELKEEEITLPFASERVGPDLFIRHALTNLPATRKSTNPSKVIRVTF